MEDKLVKIKEKIRNHESIIGTSVTFTDSSITELLADVGFDFIWIDTEHSSIHLDHVKKHIMATRGTPAAAFVRVPWNDPILVKPILEMGPDGIIFPFINTPEEAIKAVRSCLYPPDGDRGFGPQRATKYGMMDIETYIKQSSKNIWKIMQIEHVHAVDNLKEILEVNGVDTFVVGLNDLSGSIGLLGKTDDERVCCLMDQIASKAVEADVPFGVALPYNTTKITEWLERGASWIELPGDFTYLVKGAKEVLRGVKDCFEEHYS